MSVPKFPATRNIPELSINIEGLRRFADLSAFLGQTFPLKSDSYGSGCAIPLCPRLDTIERLAS
jgi:hypothetical protein